MISLNLSQRIWLSFALLILTIGLVIAIIYPLSIRNTLTEESYQIIELKQEEILNQDNDSNAYGAKFQPDSSTGFIERQKAARSVGYIVFTHQLAKIEGDYVPKNVVNEMAKHAFGQHSIQGRYELNYKDRTLFYVVRKLDDFNYPNTYLVSYMWDTYRSQMVSRLWSRLLWILFMTGLIAVIPALWLARYLRSPLIVLGKKFEQIAERNWKEPFYWQGEDEFRRLSHQFERMRQNLIRYDENQKTFIQHASHELKTPVMTIKSYAQSVKDGIMPKKSVGEMMDVILSEANRMEKRIQNMLYYTKLEAMKLEPVEMQEIQFGPLAEEVVERFRFQKDGIHFSIKGEEVVFYGDREQWTILFDNLVQNAIRYAKTEIELSARVVGGDSISLAVWNDGELLSDEEKTRLFLPFRKGNKGQYGLGLAIVKQIAELHGGRPIAKNANNGVVFEVILPIDRKK